MKLTISLPIISANKLLRMHWAKRAKIQRDYFYAIMAQWWNIGNFLSPVRIKKKKKVIITSYRKRLLDKDNLYAGAKCLGDALKKAGLIWDDSPKWINLEVKQAVDGKNPRTEVVIENVEI